jgi:hypothetical protein
MRNLTVAQLHNQVKKHRFMIVQYGSLRFAVNCAISDLSLKRYRLVGNESILTNVVSFKPCSFQEYISKKIPFYAGKISK